MVDKVTFVEADFTKTPGLLPRGCAIACVHGCGELSDVVIQTATKAGVASVALMGCCYMNSSAAWASPEAVKMFLGVNVAAEVQRTIRLEAAGYKVTWKHVPRAITPMNRIIIGRRLSEGEGEAIGKKRAEKEKKKVEKKRKKAAAKAAAAAAAAAAGNAKESVAK